MKTNTFLLAANLLIASSASTNAAAVVISNVVLGPASSNWEGDTLHANRDGSLMNGGSVTMGYFPASVTTANIDTIDELIGHLSTFTAITTAVPGSWGPILGTANPGYVDQSQLTSIGVIGYDSPLRGRMLYAIITDAPSVNVANINSQFAMLPISAIRWDIPIEETYSSNPWPGMIPLIGTIGSYTGDAGAGFGLYRTLNMELSPNASAVPESSAALLAVVGGLGLMRRRR